MYSVESNAIIYRVDSSAIFYRVLSKAIYLLSRVQGNFFYRFDLNAMYLQSQVQGNFFIESSQRYLIYRVESKALLYRVQYNTVNSQSVAQSILSIATPKPFIYSVEYNVIYYQSRVQGNLFIESSRRQLVYIIEFSATFF